jgi:hypothetical protein
MSIVWNPGVKVSFVNERFGSSATIRPSRETLPFKVWIDAGRWTKTVALFRGSVPVILATSDIELTSLGCIVQLQIRAEMANVKKIRMGIFSCERQSEHTPREGVADEEQKKSVRGVVAPRLVRCSSFSSEERHPNDNVEIIEIRKYPPPSGKTEVVYRTTDGKPPHPDSDAVRRGIVSVPSEHRQELTSGWDPVHQRLIEPQGIPASLGSCEHATLQIPE